MNKFINTILSGATQDTASQSGGSSLPWSENQDVYFPFSNIDPTKWNKIFPYRLLVYDVEKGSIVRGANQSGATPAISVKNLNDSISINVEFSDNWVCTLPITPQQISIADQFAIVNTPTLRGVLEEHNGVKYKTITMSGTTGVYPARSLTKDDSVGPAPAIDTIFSGFANSATNVINSLRNLRNVVTDKKPQTPPKPNLDLKQTGYYHAHFVQQFLEQYALAKKNPDNKSWRLVLDIPKDNVSYFVTPVSFSLSKSVQKPMEYNYSMQFTAWKRIDLNAKSVEIKPRIPGLNENNYIKLLNATVNFRNVLQSSYNTIRAVRSDVLTVANDVRQFALFIKDAGNLALTAADLPNQMIADLKETFFSEGFDVSSANLTLTAKDQKIVNSLNQMKEITEGNKTSSGVNNNQLKNYTKTSPLNNVFDQPEKNFSFFNAIDLGSIGLTNKQSERLENELDKVRSLTVQDLKDMRTNMYKLGLDLANQLGVNSEVVNQLFGRSVPYNRPYAFSIEENSILLAIYDLLQAYDNVTSTRFVDENKKLSPMKYTGDLARANEVDFNDSSTSKILVPVPYNSTIEEIAERYLGDHKRWIEISTLNYLREPYIDEDGFVLNLLSNADGRQFTVSSAKNLFVGQKINLASNVVPVFSRTILSINQLSDVSFLITVDGASDLTSLKVSDQAYMKAYLPGTVNSQDFIYIPTNQPVDTETYPTLINGIKQDSLTGAAKIDFLLTDNMDVALDANGDFRIASGIANLIQALKIKFSVEKGTYLGHPEFGIGVKPGSSTADVQASELFKDIQGVVLADPRFTGISNLSVVLKDSALTINFLVTVASTRGVVPITFTVD